jgi:hypothetical protein
MMMKLVKCDHADSEKCPLDKCPHKGVHEEGDECPRQPCWSLENGSSLIVECCPATCGDDAEYQRGYKAGYDRATAELRQDIANLRAAMLALRDLWPAERWATLSAICRDHPVIDKETT